MTYSIKCNLKGFLLLFTQTRHISNIILDDDNEYPNQTLFNVQIVRFIISGKLTIIISSLSND